VAFGKVVENGNLMPRIEHLLHADAADVSGPACDENSHMGSFFPRGEWQRKSESKTTLFSGLERNYH
jgi:hypothetical protein